MKPLAISKALHKLARTREAFRAEIVRDYERRAKDCLTCEVQGICCTDEHFVNVRVSSLEGAAIADAVEELPRSLREKVLNRNEDVLSRLESAADPKGEGSTYSCPLFEPGVGCLVHRTAKPLSCINHACYESRSDLPPDELFESAERKVALLNNLAYGFGWTVREIPFWLVRKSESAADEGIRGQRSP